MTTNAVAVITFAAYKSVKSTNESFDAFMF